MSGKREEERRKSLEALARVADRATEPVLSRASKPAPPSAPPKPATKPAPNAPGPKPRAPTASSRLDPRFEGRRAKQEEERQLREKRANQLARNAAAEWRGMDRMGVPESIRRTAWSKEEPSLQQKLGDILGDAKEKEGRAKNRDKSRRQGGR